MVSQAGLHSEIIKGEFVVYSWIRFLQTVYSSLRLQIVLSEVRKAKKSLFAVDETISIA